MTCFIYRTGHRFVQKSTLVEWDFSNNMLNDNSGDMVCCRTNLKNDFLGTKLFTFIEKNSISA